MYECLGELARIAVEPLSVDDALRRGLAALEPLFGSCDLCDTPYVAAPGEVAVALPSLTLTLILHDPPAQLDRALLQVAATQLAAALRAAELASQHEQLAGEAETDALTSVANRRALDNALAAEWLRAARRGEPIALAMLDVDFFKEYNDRYGHAVGDSCLKQVASAIVSQVRRTGETCARFGGEEFAVVLPSLDLAAAIERAEEMRNAVAAAQIAHDGSQLRRVSVSIGVAAIVPDAQTSAERLLAEADAALYTAKRRGRNRVVAGEYESQAPAATRRFDSRHNLPNYATRLIGRERAIEEIGALLATRRAVTIAGAGGVGKTRLAVAAAFDIASRFRDGAWFVDLSGLYDGARVIDQIAATLGLRETPESTLETLVLDFVREHHLLLVLDNAEHVLDAAAACVQTMLRAAPELYVLATSRVPLDLPDETVFRAAPLPTGDAVTLLLDRGEASQAQAAPREELVKLCEQLDGLPMAVELAAARLDDLSAAGIRQSLTDRFAVLVRRRGHAPQRQETLASLFAWSCDLLDPFERAALAELSVFAGTFTEAAATAVVSETPRAAELLEALVNKSLVFREESGRLRLPNSLVEFVKNELDGESRRAIELRHVQYYRDVARDANARYRTIPVRDWIATLAADDDNLRIGLARAWGGDFETVVAGAELAGELRRYFELRGHIREGIEWCDRFLSALPLNRPDEVAALLYVERARLLEVVGSIESALPSAREGVELYRRGNNPRRLAYALNQLANAEMFCQHIGDAEEHFREALRIESKLKDPLGRASVLAHLGNIALYFRLDLDRAEDYFKEAHAIFSEHGHELNVAWSLGSLAEVAYRRGDVQTALFFSEKSLAQYRAIGEHPNLPSELERYARVMIDLDRLDEAKAPLAEALRRFRDAGHEAGIVEVVGDYALLAAKRGSWTTAARLFGKVRRAADTFVHGRFDDWKRIELLIVKNLGEETFAAEASLGAQAPLDELLATMEESTLPL